MTMPAEPRFVAFARRAVQGVANQLRMDKETTSDIVLAVGEACNNGVLYGENHSNRVISVRCRVTHSITRKDDLLEIDVRNHGNGFAGHVNWNEHSMPSAESLADHGRGLPLMRSVVDKVHFLSEGGDTIVRLIKHLPG